MQKIVFLSIVLLLTGKIHAQIVVGNENPDAKTEKVKKDKRKDKEKKENVQDTVKILDSDIQLYFGVNYSYTNRYLKPNKYPFGDALGERSSETGIGAMSWEIGIHNKLNNYLMLDIGFSGLRNGEQYSYEATDTAYSYKQRYTFLAMPVRLNYYTGKRIRYTVGAGIVPQMFTTFKQETKWTTSEGADDSSTDKAKSGYNRFTASAVFSLGMSFPLGSDWRFYLRPEYRIQLNSTYDNQADYIHKGYAVGCWFGFSVNL